MHNHPTGAASVAPTYKGVFACQTIIECESAEMDGSIAMGILNRISGSYDSATETLTINL